MRITIHKLHEMKKAGERITMLTAYDYSTAKIVDEAGINLILVGDTLGMVMMGHETTVPVNIDDMLHHTKAVVRGTKNAMIIGDMPFMSYQINTEEAMRNAGRFMQEAGCQAVKLEGGTTVAGTIKRIVDAGIPVMGHIGLTPQSINQLSGYRVQGKTPDSAKKLLDDALAVQQAGAFAIVLELVPIQLAKLITSRLSIPTIGIGAGPFCDGEVQVIHDILGWFTDFVPRHTKQYAQLSTVIKNAVGEYAKEVKSGAFPTAAHAASIDEELLKDL
ncbi:MAG: 3-methyl-2-oxobutanoate hydroxymethyltransferase [Dehalococcoidia bacterium]|nr:MAG: 3-methyl-2-oxobutanoate hydroxymethyltransferase [Dehalococcoidia bacterium]